MFYPNAIRLWWRIFTTNWTGFGYCDQSPHGPATVPSYQNGPLEAKPIPSSLKLFLSVTVSLHSSQCSHTLTLCRLLCSLSLNPYSSTKEVNQQGGCEDHRTAGSAGSGGHVMANAHVVTFHFPMLEIPSQMWSMPSPRVCYMISVVTLVTVTC